MLTTTIFPGRYVQGYGALESLGEEVKRFGATAFVIADPFVADNMQPYLQAGLGDAVE